MAFANHFYHRLTRKYVSIFGSLFNKFVVKRYAADGVSIQTMPVPISYGPWQKFLARIQSDPNLNRKYQTTLPRMSFELDSIQYDMERRTSQLNRLSITDENGKNFVYNPTPYNLYFTLNIMVSHTEDGLQLVEQILPYFQPGFTPSVFLLDGLEQSIDIPVDLMSVTTEDVYDNEYTEIRFIKHTMSFMMKGYFFGPVRTGKVIKFIDVKAKVREKKNGENLEYMGSLITVQPGMDEFGVATKDLDETIQYDEIDINDDWDYITQVHGFDELVKKDLVTKDPNPNETNGKI